jgi:hypothetical protein
MARNTSYAGAVTVRALYVLRGTQYRAPFLHLMKELRTRTRELMAAAGADPGTYSLAESVARPGWFAETIRFDSTRQHEKFDDLYNQDRRAAVIQALLEETIDSARCDYVVTRAVA